MKAKIVNERKIKKIKMHPAAYFIMNNIIIFNNLHLLSCYLKEFLTEKKTCIIQIDHRLYKKKAFFK